MNLNSGVVMIMTRLVFAAALIVAAAACAPKPTPPPAHDEAKDGAGDPLQTLPNNYKLEFENDWVKVVRVHYEVGAKLPEHIHAKGTTVYVYLNDNEGVVFNHISGGERPLLRPPVKAGVARFATSVLEHHTVENTSPTPSDFIRIWFKTDGAGLGGAVRRRLPLSEQEFSNKVTRMTRPAFEAGQPLTVAPSEFPSLVVAWPSGKHYWIEPTATASIPTADPDTQGFVRVELLTMPLKSD
jgi:hypothetical protein